jgi:hypothetical protein
MTPDELIKEARTLSNSPGTQLVCVECCEPASIVALDRIGALLPDLADATNVTLQQRIETLEAHLTACNGVGKDLAQSNARLHAEVLAERQAHTATMVERDCYFEQAKAIAADHEATKARLDALRTRALDAACGVAEAENPRGMLDAAKALAKDIKEKYT